MARLTGSQRRNKRTTRTEDNKKKRTTKIQSEIARIEAGGKTTWKSKEASLKSLKKKLEISGGSSKSTTTAKKGTARARMEAKNRSIHGDAKIDALKAKHAAWKEARRRKKTNKSK